MNCYTWPTIIFLLILATSNFQVRGAKNYGKNARVSIKTATNDTKLKANNETSRGDRNYLNPLLNTPHPSSCDLTPKYCDLHCCSDKDCSSSQKEAFNCLAAEEPKSQKHNFWSCKEKTDLSSWHPFICYVTDNSPFLGQHFLPAPDQPNDINKFSKLTEDVFQFPTESNLDPEVDSPVYQVGSKVRILLNQTSAHLLLPVNVPGTGFCPRDAAVRFLKNKKTKCLRELTPANCGRDISVDKYLDKFVSKNAHGLEKANTSVRYLCSGSKGEKYVRIQKRDNRKLLYGAEKNDEKFSDCDSIFLSAFFEPRSRICYNALLKLDYILTWNGTNVTHVNATYYFADIPILEFREDDKEAPKFYLSQQFTVQFEHVEMPINMQNLNETSNSTTTPVAEEKIDGVFTTRSGNPGYLEGSPLLLGTLTRGDNSTENSAFEWDNGYLNLLHSNLDGDCAEAVPVAFGFDAITRCRFKLSQKEIANCTLLSETMADVFGSLYFGEHVAKRGDLLFTSMDDVVPILWSGVEANSSGEGCLVAAGLSVKVLFSEHWVAGVKLTRLVGLRIDPFVLNVSLPAPADLRLSTSIVFTRVDPVTKISKFWRLMMEHSENSWLEIFDPIKEVFKNEDNMEEVIVFWTFLVATVILLSGNLVFGKK